MMADSSAASTSAASLDQIGLTDDYLKSVIDLIPIDNWGFDDSVRDVIRQRKHELVDGKLTEREQRKLSNAAKQRLAKADSTTSFRTVTDVWKHIAQTSLADVRVKKEKAKNQKRGATGSEAAASIAPNKKRSKLVQGDSNDLHHAPAASREIALQRLQQRIAQLQAKRRGSKASGDNDVKKLKRQASKIKLKERKKADKTKTVDKSQSSDGKGSSVKSKKAVIRSVPATKTDSGKMVYSKFDFIVNPVEKDQHTERKEKKKTGRDKLAGRDYGRLLKKVEKRNEYVKELRDKDKDKAGRLEQNIKWNAAMQRAQGEKVKDNVDLLRKAVKRKLKAKERSKDKWAKREQTVVHNKDKRQQKRQDNLKTRRDTVKSNKLKRARKKGRNV